MLYVGAVAARFIVSSCCCPTPIMSTRPSRTTMKRPSSTEVATRTWSRKWLAGSLLPQHPVFLPGLVKRTPVSHPCVDGCNRNANFVCDYCGGRFCRRHLADQQPVPPPSWDRGFIQCRTCCEEFHAARQAATQ